MPENEKPRVRPRKFVMVELTDKQKAKLKSLADGRTERSGIKTTMADVLRTMIMEAKK